MWQEGKINYYTTDKDSQCVSCSTLMMLAKPAALACWVRAGLPALGLITTLVKDDQQS